MAPATDPLPTLDTRYRVLDRLGEGGVAVVDRAIDGLTGRHVALKRLRHDVVERAALGRRLAEEADCLGAVQHPSIPRLHACGTDPEPWIAMDLVDGRTLATILADEGPLPPRTALQIVHQLLDALIALHDVGCIHRDVKPDNLMWTLDGRLYLLDFGIARGQGTTSTADGALGTAPTMAPEQERAPDAVDARADVYAVGATLYQLLTGSSPLGLHAAPPTSPRFLDVPPALLPLVRDATTADPAHRIPDARTFQDRVAAAIPDAPVERAVAGTPVDPAQRPTTAVVAGPRGDELAIENQLRREWHEQDAEARRARSRWVRGGSIAVAVTLFGVVVAVAGRLSVEDWVARREARVAAASQAVGGTWVGVAGSGPARLELKGDASDLSGAFTWGGPGARVDRVQGSLHEGQLILDVVDGDGRYEAWLQPRARLDGDYISVTNTASFHLVRPDPAPP
jgi:hypothetical protein